MSYTPSATVRYGQALTNREEKTLTDAIDSRITHLRIMLRKMDENEVPQIPTIRDAWETQIRILQGIAVKLGLPLL